VAAAPRAMNTSLMGSTTASALLAKASNAALRAVGRS
jgi:hypothetical protein